MVDKVRFSVIIPTMQKFPMFTTQLQAYLDEPLIGEVIIINNCDTPFPVGHAKLRVLNQGGNIYVNPAWNLGVREAKEKYVCIANDDLLFDVSIFKKALWVLRLPIGILGPGEETFQDVSWGILKDRDHGHGPFRLRPVYRRTSGFGTLMFMRKSSYREIPSDLKIEFGDDFLFHQQSKRNFVSMGIQ